MDELINDEIRSWIGRADKPIRVVVSRRDIVKYSIATEQLNPKYFKGDEAPPMFLFGADRALTEIADLGLDGLRQDSLLPDLPLTRVMAGGVKQRHLRAGVPGDALLIHSGWEAATEANAAAGAGLPPSCAEFIRDHDVALLGWDLMDARTDAGGLPWPVHGGLFNFGVALLDNARLEPIADACAEETRYEFMFMLLPLNVARGTGSPANPIAMF